MAEDPKAPEQTLLVKGSTSTRTGTTRGQELQFQILLPNDSGLVLYDPQGYWQNLSLQAARSLHRWMGEWIAYQSARFKPTGWKLVSLLDGTVVEIPNGAGFALVGDSFIIKNMDGDPIGGAYLATDWELQPIITATPTK